MTTEITKPEDGEYATALERIRALKDFSAVEILIAALRKAPLGHVAPLELSLICNRPKRQVYGLIKIARQYVALVEPGLCIANVRRRGYKLTANPRAKLLESIKSGNRADGHLGQEIKTFSSIRRDDLKTIADVELYTAQQARIRLGQARLAMSNDMKSIMQRQDQNLALVAAAQADSKTPWKELGLDDPDGERN